MLSANNDATDESGAVPALPVSTEQVNDYARCVGEEFEIYDENGRADLHALLDKIGGEVEVKDGAESLAIHDDGTFTVYVSGRTSPRRDRFTIAHEVGHFLLHRLNGDPNLRRFTREGSDMVKISAVTPNPMAALALRSTTRRGMRNRRAEMSRWATR